MKGLSSSEMMKSFEIKVRVKRMTSNVFCLRDVWWTLVRWTQIKMQRNRTSLIFQHRFLNRHVTSIQSCWWILRNVLYQGSVTSEVIRGHVRSRDWWLWIRKEWNSKRLQWCWLSSLQTCLLWWLDWKDVRISI